MGQTAEWQGLYYSYKRCGVSRPSLTASGRPGAYPCAGGSLADLMT